MGKTKKTKKINVEVLKVRVIAQQYEKETLVGETKKYKLDILGISETRIKEEQSVSTINNFILFTTNKLGSHGTHGTGILIRLDLKH